MKLNKFAIILCRTYVLEFQHAVCITCTILRVFTYAMVVNVHVFIPNLNLFNDVVTKN